MLRQTDHQLEATVKKHLYSNSPRGRLGNSQWSTSRPRSTGWAPLA